MGEDEVVCEVCDEVEVDRVDVVEVFVHDLELCRVVICIRDEIVGDAELVCVALYMSFVNCSKPDCSGSAMLSGNAEKRIESAFVVAAAEVVMVDALAL